MGEDLIEDVVHATGLPPAEISGELRTLIVQAGYDPENITLDVLRKILANYLQDVLVEAKEFFAALE